MILVSQRNQPRMLIYLIFAFVPKETRISVSGEEMHLHPNPREGAKDTSVQTGEEERRP